MAYPEIEMFSALAADHIQNRRHCGPLDGATHYGCCGARGDGPYVEIWLDIREDRIVSAAYRTPGCPSSTACASVLCQLVTGRTLAQASLITERDLLLVVGGLPEGREFYAGASLSALCEALSSGGVPCA